MLGDFDHLKHSVAATALCLVGAAYPSTGAAAGPDCGKSPFAEPAQVASLLSEMEPVFAAFPDLQELISDTSLELCFAENMLEAHGYFQPENNQIMIGDGLPSGLQQAILVHELRHVRQFATGICPAPDLSMAENARAVFAMEADASATSLVVAWAMRETGFPQIWEALAASPLQQDITEAFASEMRAKNDISQATSAAFEAWFGDQTRVDAYYLAACSSYLDREDSTHQLRGYAQLDPAFFDTLCQLPNGGSYACSDPR